MSTRATIFDIPHVLDTIFSHLSKDDLAQCRLVCMTWSTFASNSIWAHVNLDDYQNLAFHHKETILKHGHLIRSLETPFLRGAFLAGLGSSINRLRLLSIRGMHFFGERLSSPPKITALELIMMNQSLELLVLEGPPPFWEYLVRRPQLVGSITSNTNLKTFELQIQRGVPLVSVLTVLHAAPRRLRRINLCVKHNGSWEESPLEDNWGVSGARSKDPLAGRWVGLEEFPLLTALTLNCPFNVNEWPILQKCPSLVDLNLTQAASSQGADRLVDTLVQHCPKLESVYIKAPLSQKSATRLAQGWKRMKVFMVSINSKEGDPYPHELIPALVAQSGSTLVILSLLRSIQLCSKDISHILENCPRLKNLHLHATKPQASELEQGSLQDLVNIRWACRNLEVLELNLSGLVPESSTLQQQDTVHGATEDFGEVFIRFCRHLCTLPWLTKASLRCEAEHLHLTFDEGEIIQATGSNRLRQNPFLLQYCALLLQSCPRLNAINMPIISAGLGDCCSAQDLLSVNWMCKDLKSMVISVKDKVGTGRTLPRFLERLTALEMLETVDLEWITHGSTLQITMTMERGSIKEFSTTGHAPNTVLTQLAIHLLSKCPQLEKLVLNDPTVLAGVALSEMLEAEWVCRDMKHLDLAISYDVHVSPTTDPDLFQHHQKQAAQMVSRFARRIINELPQFRKEYPGGGFEVLTRMRWISPVFMMPLETAVGYMDEGKELSLRMARTLGLQWKSKEQMEKRVLKKEKSEQRKIRKPCPEGIRTSVVQDDAQG